MTTAFRAQHDAASTTGTSSPACRPTNDSVIAALRSALSEIVAADSSFVEALGTNAEAVSKLDADLKHILEAVVADALGVLIRWVVQVAPRLQGCVHRLRRLVTTARQGDHQELRRLIQDLPLRPVVAHSIADLDGREVAALACVAWWLRTLHRRLDEAGGGQPGDLPTEVDLGLWWIASSDALATEAHLVPYGAGQLARLHPAPPDACFVREWMLGQAPEDVQVGGDPFDDLECTIVVLWLMDRESAPEHWETIRSQGRNRGSSLLTAVANARADR